MVDAVKLAGWRDACLILLCIETCVLALLVLSAALWSVRAMGPLFGRLRPLLFQSRMLVWRYTRIARQATEPVASSFVWIQSTAAGLSKAVDLLTRR